MKLTHAQKIFILALIAFIVVLTVNIIFSHLLIDKIIGINDKIRQLNLSSAEREKEISLKDTIQNSDAERKKLASYFVGAGNAETVKFTQYLEEQARVAGVAQHKTLDYEALGELGTSNIVSGIRYRFNATGKWNNVFTFLRQVENLPKVVSLHGVTLSAGGSSLMGQGSGKTWSADLDFSVVKLKN